MRRTVTLTIELEGARPDALALRDWLLLNGPGRRIGQVIDAIVVDDGVGVAPEHRTGSSATPDTQAESP
jgi:hypothetical protein